MVGGLNPSLATVIFSITKQTTKPFKMEQQVKAPAKKGSRTTEIVIGAGAAKLETVLKGITSGIEILNKLPETIKTTTLEVVNLEDKIGSLKQQLTNEIAQNKIEIEQAYNSNKREFVDKWLEDNNMTVIETDELDEMKTELEDLAKDKADAINQAVAAATGAMKKENDHALALAKAENEKKEASNTAEITQLKAQNKFLEEQVGHWKTMLESQQKAETERAKYGQISTLNVGNPNVR
jgi:transcriptional regulator with GAF, ATPase, and Fis domain